jgi:hypothetical protein
MAPLVETDWPNAARQLRELADAEFTARPTLSEYPDRTSVAKIPLLALDCSAEHESGAGRPCGIWSLNHGAIDEFASEYVAIATGLGMGLPGRPEGVDPLTFLLHRVSLWLWRQQQPGTGFTGFKYLYLLEKPLPDGRSIQIRQIVSLVRATELYARYKGTRFGRELNEDPALPWPQILPGCAHYPKMIDRPDGPRGRVETREEHAGLFTAGWIGRNLVSVDPATILGGEPGGPAVATSAPAAEHPDAGDSKRTAGTLPAYVFHQSESGWDLSFDGQTAHIPLRTGMKYIAELLRAPRVAIEAVRLVGAGADAESTLLPPSSALPMTDPATIRGARKLLKERKSELSQEIDWDKKEKLQEVISGIEKYLSRVEDHRGQPRLVGGDAERARKAVTMAVSRAIDSISQKLPALATHLKDSVTTGTALTYNPSEPPDWQF